MLIAIAAHADTDGLAYPSLARIASLTAIDRTKVPGSIRKLVAAGLLRAQRRTDPHGDSASTLYEIAFNRPEVLPDLATPVAVGGNTVFPSTTTPGVPAGGTLTDQSGTDQRTAARQAARRRVSASQDSAGEFEAFWQAYPSRRPHANPRKPARDKFEAAVKRGIDPAVIIRGAENCRAAHERAGTDPRYIAEAMTWLNQERWNDHQQPPEPPRLRVGMI